MNFEEQKQAVSEMFQGMWSDAMARKVPYEAMLIVASLIVTKVARDMEVPAGRILERVEKIAVDIEQGDMSGSLGREGTEAYERRCF